MINIRDRQCGTVFKPPLGILTFRTEVSGWSLDFSASDQLPAWEAADNGPSTWVSATHVGDPDRATASCLLPGPALAIAGICGVNKLMTDLSLCHSTFQINK